jgi:sugar porter (SP) family MFS transporter
VIAAAAAIGGFLFGFDTSVINGAVEAITDQFALTSLVTGLVVAVALVGSAVGAWFAGRLADQMGRLPVMMIGAGLFLISSIGAAFAFSAWDLALWRFVGGLGIGVASVIAPTYIAEVAPAHLRGRLAGLQQMAIVTGIFVALLADAGLNSSAGGASKGWLFGVDAWRWMFLVGVVPSVIYGVLALLIPESPRYLVARGKIEEAASVLSRTGAGNSSQIQTTIASIQRSLNRQAAPSFRDIRAPRSFFLPIVWVGVAFCALQQFVGINVIFYYSTSLWQAVGFSSDFSFTASVISSLVNVGSTIIGLLLIDRVGRRPLLLAGSIFMALSLGVMALGFAHARILTVDGVTTPNLSGAWGVATLIAANAFVIAFGTTWGSVTWVLISEMFPNRIRGVGVAVVTAANWAANFVVTISFPALRDVSLGLTYGIYALFAAVSFFFVLTRIPETKGRELESMTEDFRPPARTTTSA